MFSGGIDEQHRAVMGYLGGLTVLHTIVMHVLSQNSYCLFMFSPFERTFQAKLCTKNDQVHSPV